MRVEKLVDDDKELDKYYNAKDDLYDKVRFLIILQKITAKDFFEIFMKILGQNAGYRLFPYFVTTLPNNREQLIQDLEKLYQEGYINLPKKRDNLVNTSTKYSEFFK